METASSPQADIHSDFIVYCEKFAEEDIYNCLQNVVDQTRKPRLVILIMNCDFPFYFVQKVNEKFHKTLKFSIMETKCSKLEAIDFAVQKCTTGYYCLFDVDFIPTNFLERVNSLVEKKFCIIKPKIGSHGTVILRFLHNLLAGNKDKPLLDKVRQHCESNNPNSILEWD